jgi:hypothetical protein
MEMEIVIKNKRREIHDNDVQEDSDQSKAGKAKKAGHGYRK